MGAASMFQAGISNGRVKFAAIDASTSGNNTLVAAISSSQVQATARKIRVLAYHFIVDGAVTAKFQSGAGGTDLTGAMSFPANGGIAAPFCAVGHFETATNTLLNLSLGGAVGVRGCLTYQEV